MKFITIFFILIILLFWKLIKENFYYLNKEDKIFFIKFLLQTKKYFVIDMKTNLTEF